MLEISRRGIEFYKVEFGRWTAFEGHDIQGGRGHTKKTLTKRRPAPTMTPNKKTMASADIMIYEGEGRMHVGMRE